MGMIYLHKSSKRTARKSRNYKANDYMGNLVNFHNKPYSLDYVKANAIIQHKSVNGKYALAILGDDMLVVKTSNRVHNRYIDDYVLLDSKYSYKMLYTQDKKNLGDLVRQALWQGASILEGYMLDYQINRL